MAEQKPEFMQYTSYYDIAKVHLLEGPDALTRDEVPPPVEFYDKLDRAGVTGELVDGDSLRWAIMDAERDWYRANKPYYKVYPAMVTQLLNASLNVESQYLKLPHLAFTILTSPKHLFTNVPVHAAMVLALHKDEMWLGEDSSSEGEQAFRDRTLWIIAVNHVFYHHGRKLAAAFSHLPIYQDQTLEEALQGKSSSRVKRVDPEVELAAPLEDRAQAGMDMFRLVLAVALFGTSQHALVCPDLTRRQREKYDRASARDDKEAMARLSKKATGWTVGRDVRLPSWAKAAEESAFGVGRELSHAHIRRGHMRMQAYGPEMSLRKLIFVESTWIRPDLPVGPVRGYEIKQ